VDGDDTASRHGRDQRIADADDVGIVDHAYADVAALPAQFRDSAR